MIAAPALVDQVRASAPYLFQVGAPPQPADLLSAARAPAGFLQVIRHADGLLEDAGPEAYFLLCLACHQATVATYLPTDVDSKIRGRLWHERGGDAVGLLRQAELALCASRWEVESVTRRAVNLPGERPVSGHDGEHLSVLVGALGALTVADAALAARVESAVEEELEREAAVFRRAQATPGMELDVLRLAAVLAHNAGDVDQGLSYWPRDARLQALRERLHDLAHAPQRFGGTFAVAARLYSATLAPEGHRNYPLRAVKALRRELALQLPLAPFLDDWGRTVATHPALNDVERGEVAAALINGCRKIAGQQGYYRALAGLNEALSRGLDGLARHLPHTARAALKDKELRRKLAVPQASFESSCRKRAAAVFTGAGGSGSGGGERYGTR
jgi:hypothetical protein